MDKPNAESLLGDFRAVVECRHYLKECEGEKRASIAYDGRLQSLWDQIIDAMTYGEPHA